MRNWNKKLKILKASIFDLDRTLIRSNCSWDFCCYLISKKVLARTTFLRCLFYYFQHVLLKMPPARLHELVFNQFLRGVCLESLTDHVDAFISSYLDKMLYDPVVRRLELAKHLGHYTMILSSSPSFLVEKIAYYFSVDHWMSTHYAVDKDQKLCHISAIMEGERKASCALKSAEQLGICPSAITAYSDSVWDLPLLSIVGKAVAVRPDRRLRAIAKMRNWEIL